MGNYSSFNSWRGVISGRDKYIASLLDENKQNRDEYARLQIFYAENKGSLTDNINVQRAWEDNYARRKAGKMIRLRRKIVRWGYAAVVTLVIGVGVLLLTEKDDEQGCKS